MVRSMQWSQILAQNNDFCLPHLQSTSPLVGFPSEYCLAVWYGKTRMVWLPSGQNIFKISLFVLTECTHVRHRDGRTDTTWRLRPHLHSIARQKWFRFNYQQTEVKRACLNIKPSALSLSLSLWHTLSLRRGSHKFSSVALLSWRHTFYITYSAVMY